ncbi:DUF4245 family protein [Microbacterium sp. P05]|uniref:DUF4245 family protein n=1 Tax=Microbacterium sp. P05 TaxID=3366948 RepID=UPI0037471328
MARVVAELGRPETPEETATRKAQFSQRYRASKTFTNLLAAVLVTVGVILVVVLGVPRGEPAERPPIDVSAEASALATSLQRTVIDPPLPDSWRVNGAQLEGSTDAWTITYAPDDATGFLRVAQGFDASESWPVEVLNGAGSSATVTLDGIVWDEYSIANPGDSGNISYALGTAAGADRILVYGSSSSEVIQGAADALGASVRELREEAR